MPVCPGDGESITVSWRLVALVWAERRCTQRSCECGTQSDALVQQLLQGGGDTGVSWLRGSQVLSGGGWWRWSGQRDDTQQSYELKSAGTQ